MNPESHARYAALIGIDWANTTHAFALYDPHTDTTEESTLAANPNAIDHWAHQLQDRFDGPIAICVELNRGALVDQLASFDFIDIYPLNPVTSARFRKAFTPSGAKDDPSDARRHLSILLQHRDQLRLWAPGKPEDRQLQLLSENRRKLVGLQVDLRNRLSSVLKDYYPLALEVAGTDLASPMACAFLLKWPDLATLQRSKPDTIRRFFHAQGCRRGELIENRLKKIQAAKPVSTNAALIGPSVLYMRSLVDQLVALQRGLSEIEEALSQAYQSHPDHALWQSFPGAGQVLGPRLLCAWNSDRDRFQGAREMQVYSGVAPVRQASGKRETVFRRYHRPLFIHQTFWEYAKCSTLYCPWAKAYVEEQVQRGRRRSTAYRSLAFKWQRIMFACWKTGEPYDPTRYHRALEKSGSRYHPKMNQAA
jgi:transposase